MLIATAYLRTLYIPIIHMSILYRYQKSHNYTLDLVCKPILLNKNYIFYFLILLICKVTTGVLVLILAQSYIPIIDQITQKYSITHTTTSIVNILFPFFSFTSYHYRKLAKRKHVGVLSLNWAD